MHIFAFFSCPTNKRQNICLVEYDDIYKIFFDVSNMNEIRKQLNMR